MMWFQNTWKMLWLKHNLQEDTSIKRYTDYKKMIEENEIELVELLQKVEFMQKLLYTVLNMEFM